MQKKNSDANLQHFFFAQALRLWNRLPRDIRSAESGSFLNSYLKMYDTEIHKRKIYNSV